MNKFFILLLSILFISNFQSQQLKPEIYKTPIELNNISGDWGTDVAVSNFQPFGKISGIQKSNGTIYVAIPDTNLVAGRCLVVLSSTNLGSTWSIVSSVSPAGVVSKAQMVRSGLDSIYCVFLFGTSMYCWNVVNNNFNAIAGTFRDFDAVASSTGGLYVFQDVLTSNSIPRVASINGFATISQTATVTSAGAHPRVYMSGSGDTLVLNYYGPILADTPTSIIRVARYRETAAGTLSTAGSFADIVTSTTNKSQYQSVFHGGVIWFLWTEGVTGSINIKCKTSVNSGGTYGTEFLVAGNTNVDEYWFEAKHYTLGTGGCEIAYYSDSLQAGPPTNGTDRIMYRYSNLTTPGTFSAPVPISEHPPGWSARGYIPAMIELYPTSDVGVLWVGLDGANNKVYWDRYSAVVGVNPKGGIIPQNYSLGQNYPNPFNPSTKIQFTIPKDEFVIIKVYDILGKEVSVLVSKDMKKGIYEIDFNGIRLSSGLYFYKMTAGDFTDVKKMILIK